MEYNFKKLPAHIGYIIDGNGRWAKSRGLSRSMGHKAGLKTLGKIIKETFYTYNIKHISVYAFSTENWNRPKEEVDYLMNLFKDYFADDFIKEYPDVKLNIMGDVNRFPEDLKEKALSLMEKTKDNSKYILNLGVNYGGHDEILMAVNKILEDKLSAVDKETFENYLYTAGQPPLDFLVRTSGENRLSNFMLWQVSYAELYFPKVHWPDFDKHQLFLALKEFESRDRRFGAIKE